MRNASPGIAGEVSHGAVLVAVVVVVVADIAGESKLGIGRIALDVDEGALGTNDVAGVARDGVVEDGGRGTEDVNGWAGEITTVHLRVARSRVVGDDVVGQVKASSRWCWDLPALVLVVVLADEHRLLTCVLNGVVLGDDIGRAVNPQAVPATNGADGVAVEFNHGTTNTNTGTLTGPGDDVAFCVDLGTVVGGQTSAFGCGDVVVGDFKRVFDVPSGLERVGVNGVTLDINLGIPKTPRT